MSWWKRSSVVVVDAFGIEKVVLWRWGANIKCLWKVASVTKKGEKADIRKDSLLKAEDLGSSSGRSIGEKNIYINQNIGWGPCF